LVWQGEAVLQPVEVAQFMARNAAARAGTAPDTPRMLALAGKIDEARSLLARVKSGPLACGRDRVDLAHPVA